MNACNTLVFSLILTLAASVAHAESLRLGVLPDTQNFTERDVTAGGLPGADIFNGMTTWLADSANGVDFVSHVGDIVQHGENLNEWVRARAAADILDAAGMPYGWAEGNHDAGGGGTVNYLANFGPQHYASQPWYVNASPSRRSNYQQVSDSAGRKYGFLHLCIDTPQEELDWAKSVLTQQAGVPTVMTTHRYLYDYRFAAGRFAGGIMDYFDEANTNVLFNEFVATNPNIFMVLCGHVDGEWNQTSANVNGKPVLEVMQDYQSSAPLGGTGWLRVVDIDADAGTISFNTYSPLVGRYRTIQDQREDAARVVAGYAGEVVNLLGSMSLDPSTVDLVTAVVAQPGALTALYTGAKTQDPDFLALLEGVGGMVGLPVDEIIPMLDEVPWSQINEDFIAVLDTPYGQGTVLSATIPVLLGENPGDVATLLFGDGSNGILSQNDWALLDAAMDFDGPRATSFTAEYNYASYVVPEPATLTLMGLGGLALIRRRRA